MIDYVISFDERIRLVEMTIDSDQLKWCGSDHNVMYGECVRGQHQLVQGDQGKDFVYKKEVKDWAPYTRKSNEAGRLLRPHFTTEGTQEQLYLLLAAFHFAGRATVVNGFVFQKARQSTSSVSWLTG